ncbi:MAG TPA: diguanylate cyclase [Vicinamibacterales bacterium]|nr:diguanylate cyclase [Vicinamibacterales bacterium]
MNQKLTLLRGGEPLPQEVLATEAQLTGSVRYLFDYVNRMLKLTPSQLELIRPGFETLDLAIGDKIEDWNQMFLHVLEELRQKGVELEQREALLSRMRRDGRTLLYRRELGEERLLTTLREEHRGNGFGIEMVDHDRFKYFNDTYGHEVGDLVLSTTGRLFRMHREGDIGVRWGGDEFLRIVRNLVTDTQLGLVAGRDAELVDSFAWESLDERFKEHWPRLSIGLVYCERPSIEERARMMKMDDGAAITPEQRFDTSVAVPAGSSYDIARKLVALADQKMYEAKRTFADSTEPHITQTNVRIVAGTLVEI